MDYLMVCLHCYLYFDWEKKVEEQVNDFNILTKSIINIQVRYI